MSLKINGAEEDRMEEMGVGRWVEVKRDLGLWMLGCPADI